MKLKLSRFLKIIAVILPMVMMLMLIPYKSRNETPRIRGFYQEGRDTLDVVLMGASEVFAAFAPGVAYDEYGFTSYDYAISQNYTELMKPQLEEVLRTQSPQVVVVDVNTFLYVGRNSSQDATFRTYIEGVPLSLHKIQMIREFPYREQPLSYYIPFIMYHGNLSLRDMYVTAINEKAMWEYDGALLKGAGTWVDNIWAKERIDISQDHSQMPLPEAYEQGFRDFLEYCQTIEDTEILFVTMPHRIIDTMGYERFQQSNAAAEIIESYGFDYINMEHMWEELGLDDKKDFYNTEHLNVHGQRKFTRYLSNLLVEEYGVTPRPQTEHNQARWEQTVKYTKLLYAYFGLLSSKDPGMNVQMTEESWLISELNWMEEKLIEDGLPLTFEPIYPY